MTIYSEIFTFKTEREAEACSRNFQDFPNLKVSPIERVFVWYKLGYRYRFEVTIVYKP